MISKESMKELTDRKELSCPICYARLNESNYVKVPPQIESKVPSLYEKPYTSDFNENKIRDPLRDRNNDEKKSSDNNRYIIYMRGVVGAGKTTLSDFIQNKYSKLGFKVYNLGTDKFCQKGMHMRAAIEAVRRELKNAVNVREKCIVIIDTCGENKTNTPFEVDFSNWTSVEVFPNLNRNNLMGYLAWSLTNVLSRGSNGNFYLCPSAKPGQEGINLCKDVHRKKAQALNLYDRNFATFNDSDRLALAAQYARGLSPVDFDLPL
jgi:hypothetical protein